MRGQNLVQRRGPSLERWKLMNGITRMWEGPPEGSCRRGKHADWKDRAECRSEANTGRKGFPAPRKGEGQTRAVYSKWVRTVR